MVGRALTMHAHVEVDAGRQDADVADHARFAGSESGERSLPVLARGLAVHVFGRDARLDEALGDVLGVPAIDAEAERRPSLAAREPGFDDVARTSRPCRIASASSPSWKSPATVRTPARSGSLGAKTTNSREIAVA